ncbi:alpha/beta fold hydrolase [Microcella daejeonensis]|uniref:alpha/beta hydrolase n=1 Tax=Microcella daejeonensis TaxID=2994971 RepID=UPI00227126B3|nr:alpha/beta fold hydrolase [Microcella daejeonensis]WAB83576.1 alpha/beta fold hydrolase [Microcella daejeonensis]
MTSAPVERPFERPFERHGAVRLLGVRRHVEQPTALAVLLAGSGPIDRDGDGRGLALGIQRQLAEGLAGHGIESVRWDKRGVGASEGEFLTTGFDDLLDDALGVVDDALGGDLPVLVIGHSEGAALAARVAALRPGIAGAVMLSGYARSGLEVLRWQARALSGDLPRPLRALLRLLRTDLERQTEKNRQRLLRTTGDVERVGGARVNARWFREFMAYDPRADLDAASVPLLAVTGSLDLQSPPEDLAVIAARTGGSTRTVELEGVSHILRSQPRATLRTYRVDARRPIDERIVPLIAAWWSDLCDASV